MAQSIETSILEFHNKSGTFPFDILLEGEQFGIFNMAMKKVEITKTPLFILFTIDKTGSMAEYGGANRTCKMDYVKTTFKNMLNYLAKQNIEIYIRVHSFNVRVDVDIENSRIAYDNLDELVSKIEDLQPESSTNIELALTNAADTLRNYTESYPEHQIAHIFMTDGEPTIGQNCKHKLAELVDENFANIFIGFGLDHNAVLLNKLSEKKNAEYQFVNDMENTALVYGETIHRFLYPALSNVEIRVTNGLIYDWQTNQWTEQVYEPVLIGESLKTYHIRSSTPDIIEVGIYSNGELIITEYSLPELIGCIDNVFCVTDLTRYAFRQKVLQLLHFARVTDNRLQQRDLKVDFKTTFRQMRQYMRENGLLDDPFMKLLCDDISITYSTIGTRAGHAFVSARQTSQGRQQTYTPSRSNSDADERLIIRKGGIRRQNAMGAPVRNFPLIVDAPITPRILRVPSIDEDDWMEVESRHNDGDDLDDDDLDSFNPSNTNMSCYATEGALQTMRCMSQNMDTDV